MEERQLVYDQFMDAFIKLDATTKEKEIIEKQKKIIEFLVQHAFNNGISINMLKSNEITDIASDKATHDDFLEAIMVYTQNIEELVGQIINR